MPMKPIKITDNPRNPEPDLKMSKPTNEAATQIATPMRFLLNFSEGGSALYFDFRCCLSIIGSFSTVYLHDALR